MITRDDYIQIRMQLEALQAKITLLLTEDKSKGNTVYLQRMSNQIKSYYKKIAESEFDKSKFDKSDELDALRFIDKLSKFQFDYSAKGTVIIQNQGIMDVIKEATFDDILVSCLGIKYAYESILPVNWLGSYAVSFQSLNLVRAESKGRWSLYRANLSCK